MSNGPMSSTIRAVLTMRILLPFWRGMRERTFFRDFHQGVTEALRELGHEPIRYSFAAIGPPPHEEAETLSRQIECGKLDAVLDLCCRGFGLSQVTLVCTTGGRIRYSMF
jgi:hypothetical protein